MALLHGDNPDYYATAQLAVAGYTNVNGASVVAATGRGGRAGWQLGNETSTLDRVFPTAVATIIVGIGFRLPSLGDNGNNFLTLYESGSLQLDIRIDTTVGKFYVTRNGTSLGMATMTGLIVDVNYYLEIKATIDNATGSVELRLWGGGNAGSVLTVTGADTQTTATAQVTSVRFNGTRYSPSYRFDMYICDTAGSVNNDFLGDTKCEVLFPNGNGNSSQLVGSDTNSTDNYLLVDEAGTPSTADYVESSTPGDKDTYAYGNLATTTGTVRGVIIVPYADKTDAGDRSIVSVARLSATEVDSSTKGLSTTVTYLPDVRETKPGGGAWSVTDVNSAEFGVKVSA